MRVKWHPKAKMARDQVADYVKRYFGEKRKMLFLQQVRQTTQKLKSSPNIGQIDPLFTDHSRTYRSVIINGLNKLVYCIDGNILHVVAFWDTRCEPQNQVQQTE